MDNLFVSIPISDSKNICISALDKCLVEENELSNLGNDFGLFVYIADAHNPAAIEILAKLSSRDAADTLQNIFRCVLQAKGINRPVEYYSS
jgi:hypothetical protein